MTDFLTDSLRRTACCIGATTGGATAAMRIVPVWFAKRHSSTQGNIMMLSARSVLFLVVGLVIVCSGLVIAAASTAYAVQPDASPSVSLTSPHAPALSGADSVSAGYGYSCAVTSIGGVKCWGDNGKGQLGIGSTTGYSVPVDVSGLGSGVRAVATGAMHACALTTDGGVKCWGDNSIGELGIGFGNGSLVPVDVTGLISGVAAISARGNHTCALMAVSGGVKCWGNNSSGQLGIGTSGNQPFPTDVSGLNGGVTAIAAGANHTCALMAGGSVKCWGANYSGQLGIGSTTNYSVPMDVTSLSSGVAAISTGGSHTCALLVGGNARCWGFNGDGELGDGTMTNQPSPVTVVGLGGLATGIAAGDYHTCATMAGGGAMCWGNNQDGKLGDGTFSNSLTPTTVIAPGAGIWAIAVGDYHTCALSPLSNVYCWGANWQGQLGKGDVAHRTQPLNVNTLSTGVSAIALGALHSCVVTLGGGVKCWGWDTFGQLGDGGTVSQTTPTDVSGLSSTVNAVAPGLAHTCVRSADGGVRCWGRNDYGQLGNAMTVTQVSPVDVTGLASGVMSITAGYQHTCALMDSGGVKCWGSNQYKQLGVASGAFYSVPVDTAGLVTNVVAIAAGDYHTCALMTGGGVKCWGRNTYGQLGNGSTTGSALPVDVSGLPSGVSAIAAGRYHTCALTNAGGVKCWGFNFMGQLGNGSSSNSSTPVDVSGLSSGMASVAAGGYHTCALTTGGGAKCWGYNSDGQLGDGSTTSASAPIDVPGLSSGGASIATGYAHTCAVTIGTGVKCWGLNGHGQLGIGTAGHRPLPDSVVGFGTTSRLYLPAICR